MSKSDEKLERIDVNKAWKHQTEPTWRGEKQINAFDTETFRGTVFMLSYAIGDRTGVEDSGYISQLSPETIFERITNRQCRSALNVWYNLDFDANAILANVLTDKQLAELSISGNTLTEVKGMPYEVTYVKGKFLLLKDAHGNNYKHFDISQFFYASLNDAAKEWLGETKIEEIDTSRFDDASYIMQNYDLIREYAIKDAELTQRLANKLVDEAEKLGIPMGAPFSTGYLSGEYVRANTEKKPGFGSVKYQSMFWDSYYGGRFEVFERGQVGEVAAPDINSAYPAVMKDLPDPTTVDWKHYNNEGTMFDSFDIDTLKEGDWGVVKATVTTDPDEKIQPFAYKLDGRVTFPILTDTEITVIMPIFLFAVKHGIVTDYELHEAWIGYEQEYTEYPFRWLGELYADRKVWEVKDGKMKKGLLVKIVINSSYGKTCQTTERKKIVNVPEGEEYRLNHNEVPYPYGFLAKEQRDVLDDDDVVVVEKEAGRRFNPFVASYITGMTRLELHKQVVEHDLVEDTIMFATDCLMVRKSAYDRSDFESLIQTPDETLEGEAFRESAIESLGKWDFDYVGNAFVVGSGVYEVELPRCKKKDCDNYGSEDCDNYYHKLKTKTRGFLQRSLDGSLKEMGANNPDGIPIDNHRPLTINEVVQSPDRGSVSEFIKDSKTLPADFDSKREWGRQDTNFTTLLTEREKSFPIDLRKRQQSDFEPKADVMLMTEISSRDLPIPSNADTDFEAIMAQGD